MIQEEEKMEAVSQLVSQASDFLWNVILIILLCGTGIMFTIRLKFIQVRKRVETTDRIDLSGKTLPEKLYPDETSRKNDHL